MEYLALNDGYIKNILKKRKKDTHKGDYGRLLAVAGSKGMTGAALLCAKGAFKAGSGLVYICIDESLFNIFQIAVPEAICIDRKNVFRENLNSYDCIVFGPGIGMDDSSENMAILLKILNEYEGKLLIDADGLNTVSKFDMQDALKNAKAEIVITPHAKEAERLLGSMPEERIKAAKMLHKKTGAVSVLKGHESIVAGEKIYINTTGNPGMATAGSGDVLSGAIGSLLAQKYSINDAALAGVYLHGLAGDIKASEDGMWGITASDIADGISLAIRDTIGE